MLPLAETTALLVQTKCQKSLQQTRATAARQVWVCLPNVFGARSLFKRLWDSSSSVSEPSSPSSLSASPVSASSFSADRVSSAVILLCCDDGRSIQLSAASTAYIVGCQPLFIRLSRKSRRCVPANIIALDGESRIDARDISSPQWGRAAAVSTERIPNSDGNVSHRSAEPPGPKPNTYPFIRSSLPGKQLNRNSAE